MKITLSIVTVAFVLLAAGMIQQQAFSQPGNAPGLSQGQGGPPDPFALPRTDNQRANERSRPGGPRLDEGQELWIIPGQGVVISPS